MVEKAASTFKSKQGKGEGVDVNTLWGHLTDFYLKAKMHETDRDVIIGYTILSPKTAHEYLNL